VDLEALLALIAGWSPWEIMRDVRPHQEKIAFIHEMRKSAKHMTWDESCMALR